MYLLAPFIVQNLKEILAVDPEFKDAPYSDQKTNAKTNEPIPTKLQDGGTKGRTDPIS